MDFNLFVTYWPLLLKGLGFTLYVCFYALIIGLVWGMVLYQIGAINNFVTRFFYRLYLNVFRGTPLLVQIYLVFYGGPFIGIQLSATQVGITGLGLYVAAYFAEIYRSGFNSIPQGQIEAARDLGFSRWQIFTRIQVPQMLGLIIPPGLNQSIIMVKESALLSIITVPEMTTSAIRMATETFTVIEPYLFLATAYWLITFSISIAANWLERKSLHYLSKT
ncbi:MAG: amino acid ABC transporter permease [Arenicella sp.]